jgi:propionyl-CoA carboxylase alpha chain
MFKKILIANRGEIAGRVIKTARRMGIATVAVYSDADQGALHVAQADEAVAIGPAPANQSYLAIEKIVEACKATGAEAVHPGYGFLSERAAFAEALAKAGIVFIGPHARAIAAMGDKIESKKLAAKAGVATVPGFLGVIGDEKQAVKIAEEIGYPVMIKAAAGGGGKGMRIAHSKAEVAEGFARARSEAKSSFGDDRVFIEKFIENPRHVEIQVLGDKHGNLIHLYERECSIQRRHQKIVEEAPSPLIDAATREKMGAQAVALAKAVDYDSAGTVEFVAGQDRSFYFLEMNTRLQVEHPVTEFVTGLDLVEQMIRAAAGEKLAIQQSDVKLKGSAIESRIYAEDPLRDFLPSVGRLTRYRPPKEGKHGEARLRIDSGVEEGSEIGVHYDPLIAKLVIHAPSRAAAIAAQADALDQFAIDGVQHNIPFLAALMQHPRFREGRLSTGFIAEEYPDGFFTRAPAGERARLLGAVAAAIDHVLGRRKRLISGQLIGREVTRARERVIRQSGHEFIAEVTSDGGAELQFGDGEQGERLPTGEETIRVTYREGLGAGNEGTGSAGQALVLEPRWKPGQPVWTGRVDGREIAVRVRLILNGFRLAWRGTEADVFVFTACEAALARLMPAKVAADAGKLVRCPMPGLVLAIAVAVGQEVKTGEPLAVVEAMKMENVLRAERDGRVKIIHVKSGDSIAVDAVILEFE